MSPKPPKKHSKKRKRHRSPDAAATTLKLLEAAALGKTRRVRKLLDKDKKPRSSLNAFDAEGLTALHHASRNGHLDTAQLLLRSATHGS
jgi:ankyrin repeat protein